MLGELMDFYDGIAIAGTRKTVIQRKYIDGFVNCMNDVYGVPWTEIEAVVSRTKLYPLILSTNYLAIAVAPFLLKGGAEGYVWEKGKYNPKSKVPVDRKEVIIKRVDLNELLRQVKDGGIVAIYRCPHCGGKLKVGKDTTVERLESAITVKMKYKLQI